MTNNEFKIGFNDEIFRNIYEESLISKKIGWTLDLTPFKNGILNTIQSFVAGNSLTDTTIELNFKPPKEPSREEKLILNIKKAHNLSLYHAIDCDISDEYIYGFHSFSYEEFLSYVFWRTKLRENIITDTPNSFLAMFLIEIVNFIEYDDYNECLEKLLNLKNYFDSDEHKLRMINTALEEFILLYGAESDYFNNCNTSEFEYLFEMDEIVNRTHSDVYNFILQHTSGAFKQLSFYKKYKNCIGDDFEPYFYSIVDYFNSCGIDILKFWFGQKNLLSSIYFSYVKFKYPERISEKNIIYRNDVIYSISKLSQNRLTRVAQDEDLNSGQCVFLRGYLMRYPLRLYENIKRKRFGIKLINSESALDDLIHMSENSHILTQILNIYQSDDFKKKFIK